MRNAMRVFLAWISLVSPAWTQEAPAPSPKANDFGAGIVLGDTLGATGKLWLDRYSALDLNLGADSSNGRFTVSGDYLFHGWKALPQPSQGRLAAYLGAGPRLTARSDGAEFGIKALAGASYFLPRNPIEVYAEVGPFFRMTPSGGVFLIGGLGARVYFKSWN